MTVPNAVIQFKSSVSCSSTTYDDVSDTWITTLPLLLAAATADEIFAAGLAYPLPASFAQNISNLSWSASVYSTASALQVSLAVWRIELADTKNGTNFPLQVDGTPDYNGMMINPAHNAPICNASYGAGDHAGAPEFPGRSNVVTGGGSGGGGSNWTGSWSSTPAKVGFVCSTGSVSKGDTATIGYWHNKNGQALINALNGGPTSKTLANWLATQFPYLYGGNSAQQYDQQDQRGRGRSVHDVLQRDRTEDRRADPGGGLGCLSPALPWPALRRVSMASIPRLPAPGPKTYNVGV